MREDDGDHQGDAEEKPRMQIPMFAEKQGGQSHGVKRFEIVSEIDGEDAEAAKEFDIQRESEDRADEGQDEQPAEIAGRRPSEWGGGDQGDRCQREAGAGHLVERDGGVVVPLGEAAVDHRKDRTDHGRRDGQPESGRVAEFKPQHQPDGRNHQPPENHLVRPRALSMPPPFKQGAPNQRGRKPGHRDGGIAHFAGAKKADPVGPDQHAACQQGNSRARRDTQPTAKHRRNHRERDGGEPGAPNHQLERGQMDEDADDGGEAPREHHPVQFELIDQAADDGAGLSAGREIFGCPGGRAALSWGMPMSPLWRKSLVWGWVGVCLGFAGGHGLARLDRAQERAAFDAMRAEFASLKKEALELGDARARVAVLEKEVATTQETLAASLAAPQPPAPVPAEATEAPPDPKKAFSDMVLRIGQAQLKGQLEGRVGVLKERLGLTPEQEAAVKRVMESESAAATEALDRLMSRQGTPSDFGRLSRLQRGLLPDDVEAVLTDAQKPEYAAFREQEQVSSMENRVNMELSSLVAAGGLTPEQKDQAFSTLGGVLMAEDSTDFDAMKDTAEVRTYMDEAVRRRLDALQPILTEPQQQMYQRQVDMGRQVLTQLLPADPQ